MPVWNHSPLLRPRDDSSAFPANGEDSPVPPVVNIVEIGRSCLRASHR